MREIDNYFKDFLKINGFICKKTSWYRFTPDLVQIINLQKSQYGNCYYFNLGLDIMTCEKKAYKYPPEYKFPVRLRIESVVNEESLLKSLDFENSYDSIMRACYLNQLIEATINFFNTVMTIDDIIAAYTDPNHPLLKSLTTNEFKRYIYEEARRKEYGE